MSRISRIGTHVDLTIIGVSEELLHEFSEYVVKPLYPGGISEAILDLMKKAVEEQKQKARNKT
jgi:hypothetical protein